jgi:hypothetical protein
LGYKKETEVDEYRKQLDKCGKGGIKCPCCKPKDGHKKDRKISRKARRCLKNFHPEDNSEGTEHVC